MMIGIVVSILDMQGNRDKDIMDIMVFSQILLMEKGVEKEVMAEMFREHAEWAVVEREEVVFLIQIIL